MGCDHGIWLLVRALNPNEYSSMNVSDMWWCTAGAACVFGVCNITAVQCQSDTCCMQFDGVSMQYRNATWSVCDKQVHGVEPDFSLLHLVVLGGFNHVKCSTITFLITKTIHHVCDELFPGLVQGPAGQKGVE